MDIDRSSAQSLDNSESASRKPRLPYFRRDGKQSQSADVKSDSDLLSQICNVLLQDESVIGAGVCHQRVTYCRTGLKDLTWGCGYRNIQHVLSVLMSTEQDLYRATFGKNDIWTIKDIQSGIEEAWSHGYDVEGAAQLKHKLVNKQKWIGTTEAYALFTSLGYTCAIMQFSGPDRALKIMSFCREYFMVDGGKVESLTVCNDKLPLYFQHQGHSRTIVGYAQTKACSFLLVFDPAKSTASVKRKLARNGRRKLFAAIIKDQLSIQDLSSLLLKTSDLTHKVYQLLKCSGQMLTKEEQSKRQVIRPQLI